MAARAIWKGELKAAKIVDLMEVLKASLGQGRKSKRAA